MGTYEGGVIPWVHGMKTSCSDGTIFSIIELVL